MKIAKEFRWEMGHRLPFHEGLCKNIHGHSYKMDVEIIGNVNESGMIIDFYDLGKVIKPILDDYDHAFLCWANDKPLIDFLEKQDMKRVIVTYHSTVENICSDLIEKIFNGLRNLQGYNFQKLNVKIFETPNSFAESSMDF